MGEWVWWLSVVSAQQFLTLTIIKYEWYCTPNGRIIMHLWPWRCSMWCLSFTVIILSILNVWMYEAKLLTTTLSAEFPHIFVIVNKSHEKKSQHQNSARSLNTFQIFKKICLISIAVTAGCCKQKTHYFVFSALATM